MIYNIQTMIRYKIIWFYLLCCVYYATSKEATEKAEDRTSNVLKPPDKLILKKSQPYSEKKDEPTFMSKLASWIFPSGGSEKTYDSIPAAGQYGAPQYLPAPEYHSHSHIEKDCNPCNEVPWIPITPNFHEQTVLSFVPPEVHFNDFSSHGTGFSGLETLHPPSPQNLYVAPPQFRPKSPKMHYGLPNPGPHQFRGLPPSKTDEVILDYMLPPPVNYKIPSLIYGPPRGTYTPPEPIYRPPNKPIYGPPPKPVYGPPSKPIYGPPPKPVYGPPQKPIYGPPPQNLPNQYGPPSLSFQPPPELQTQYGAPQNNPSTYLRPVAEGYSPLSPDFTPPLIHHNYGPPQQIYGPTNPTVFLDENTVRNIPPAVPSDSYGAPVTGDNLNYLLPSEQLSQPSGYNSNLERPIALPNLSSAPVAPIHDYNDFNQGFNIPQHGLKDDQNVEIQQSVNIADYLATVEHPINVIQSPIIEVSVKDEHFDLQHELPSNQYGIQNFDDNYGDSVQKSFKTGDNINTGENSANTGTLHSELIDSQIYNEKNGFSQVEEKTYNSINEKLHDSGTNTNHYDSSSFKLSENPIIVEDVHTAASNINNTFVKSKERQVKRTNDKHLSISTFINEHVHSRLHPENVSVSTNLIKKLLLDKEHLGNIQTQVANIKKAVLASNNRTGFTTPVLEYGNWEPAYTSVSEPSTRSNSFFQVNYSTTTSKPKQLQIIIPYVTNKKSGWFEKDWSPPKDQRKHTKIDENIHAYTTLLPIYTPPSSTEISIWSKYIDDFNLAESKRVTATAFSKPTTIVYNIKDFFKNKSGNQRSEKLPYDIVSLQKNIDDWTQQSYSVQTKAGDRQRSTERILTSKKIPDDYFTTITPYEITTRRNEIFDHQSDGSSKEESILQAENSDIETNLIIEAETTTQEPVTSASTTIPSTKSSFPSPFAPKGQRSLWDVSQVTVSPHTKEKVYVVTPQTYSLYTSTPATAWSMAPKIQNGIINNASTYDSHKFSIRVEPESKNSRDKLKKELKGSVKVVFSEWPHLINNLQTTTIKSTSRHPLFGLMDIPSYTPSPNTTVETILGHSRVVTVVTPSSATRKKATENSARNATIKVTTSSPL